MEKPEPGARNQAQSQPEPALAPLQPGQLVAGRYRVIAPIGQGGMGAVYRVEQVFLRQQFALKTISGAGVSDSVWRRFEKEAKAAALLDHPNLVKVRDFGLEDVPFFVMDLVEGETLSALIKANQAAPGSRLSQAAILEIFAQVSRALGYAHSRGVIHRDIKPSNIIVANSADAKSLKVKVVDFGIAKLVSAEALESMALTRTGEVFGTPFYMSPEQCLGGAIDHRADIYSVGCVLFEALTGLPPFMGDGALTTIMKQQSEAAPTLREASLGRS
ncbi:MAG TPA: serine/threonine-protein kinase, partial [Chroococcales cyanobacterium]